MNPEKKVSLFAKSMREKTGGNITKTKGFPEAKVVKMEEELNKMSIDKKEENKKQTNPLEDFFDSVPGNDIVQMDENNAATIDNMSEEEIQKIQELYYKEFSQEVIERFAASKEKAKGKAILEDPLLKGKLADDFSVTALKNSIFSEQVYQRRDISTFFERIYYDNYGDYEELDEKTTRELQSNQGQFNSIVQLMQAVKNNRASQALCSQILGKILMVLKVWKKSEFQENIVLSVGVPERKMSVKIREIIKTILVDHKFVETIILACENQGFINFSLLSSSLKVIKKLLMLNMRKEMNKLFSCWDVPEFLNKFDELKDENSFIDKSIESGLYGRIMNILTKGEVREEIYPAILRIQVIFACFAKRKNLERFFGLSKDILVQIIDNLHSVEPQNANHFNLIRKSIYNVATLLFAIIKNTDKANIDPFIQERILKISQIYNKLKSNEVFKQKEAKTIQHKHLKALILLYQDENLVVEPTFRQSIFSILQLNLFQKSLSKQQNLLKAPQSALATSTDPTKRNLFASIFCELLSGLSKSPDFNLENLNLPTADSMEVEDKKDNILQLNLFESLQIANREELLHCCNEFYSPDSTLIQRDFLQNNFVIIDQSYLFVAKRLLQTFISLKDLLLVNNPSDGITKIYTWLFDNLKTFCDVLLVRNDLWYTSKSKIEAKKHPQYKKLKRLTLPYYEEILRALVSLLPENLSQITQGPFKDNFILLRLKIISLCESFGWASNISISTYHEASEGLPTVLNCLRNDATTIVRLFALQKKRKIDHNMSDMTYCKIVRTWIKIQACLINEIGKYFVECLPINSYLVKFIKIVFDNDFVLYLEKETAEYIKIILRTVGLGLKLDQFSSYYTKNTDEVDALIDRYSFYSYGDAIFSNILFLFAGNSFPDQAQRSLWTAISMYAYNFQDVLINEPLFPLNLEDYKPKSRVKSDLKEQVQAIAQGLEHRDVDPLREVITLLVKS